VTTVFSKMKLRTWDDPVVWCWN